MFAESEDMFDRLADEQLKLIDKEKQHRWILKNYEINNHRSFLEMLS